MRLDTAYFAENKKVKSENNKKCFFGYCSYDMNSAPGAGLKKRKKRIS